MYCIMWWIHWLGGLFGGSSVKSVSTRLLLLSGRKVLLRLTNWLWALFPPLYLQCNYLCRWVCVCGPVCLSFRQFARYLKNAETDFSDIWWKVFFNYFLIMQDTDIFWPYPDFFLHCNHLHILYYYNSKTRGPCSLGRGMHSLIAF